VSTELCAICARTLAPEDGARVYSSSKGSRTVCARCASRAEKIGWRPADGSGAAPAVEEKRRGGLAGLFRRSAGPEPPAPPEPPAAPAVEPAPAPAPEPSPDPAAPGARAERLEPEPFQASPFERAVARFNDSDVSYTVEGLVRTLGTPWVSVGASAGSPSEVRITVAWELSWYQWGVDLDDAEKPVFDIAKGAEIDQLDSAARQWNASAHEGGQIVLAAVAGEKTGG
jgi:hypothetical protein